MDEIITSIEVLKSEADDGSETFELWWSDDLWGTFTSEEQALKALYLLVLDNY